jgi:hypothetical protein
VTTHNPDFWADFIVNAVIETVSALGWFVVARWVLNLAFEFQMVFALVGLVSAEIRNRIADLRSELRRCSK